MTITVNGEIKEFRDNSSLQEIIESLGIADKVMASAVNMVIVKKDEWSRYVVKNGDKLELLNFVGGG
jgi:sulfur carrier protein